MVKISDLEKVLEVYSLEEILEYNEMTPSEALYYLLDGEYVDLKCLPILPTTLNG